MIELKGDFSGGLNLDDSPYAIPKNCYVDAQNISRDAIAGSNDRVITNVVGNRPILISKSTAYSQSVLQKWYEYTITINSPLYVSAGMRTVVYLDEISVPPLGQQVVCDFTSTINQTAEDYCAQVAAAFYKSVDTASLFFFGGTIVDGIYTVNPSSTNGVGYGSIFELTFSGNALTTINVVFGGVNYKNGDVIIFNGSLFGGVDGVDDVSIYVTNLGLPSGVLAVSSLGNSFSYRFNYGSPLPILRWAYAGYTISLGHQLSGYTCIGAYPNTVRDTVIYFLHNNADYHMILEFNVKTEITLKILENLVDTGGVNILNFGLDKKICNVNVFNRDEGDLLYFLDTLGRPTGLDIEKFKSGEYTPVTRDIIDVCKRPPLSPPSYIYENDISYKNNNLRGKFFRFKTRYIYDDLSISVCSPISEVIVPPNINDANFTNVITNNNKVVISFNSGDKDVSKVQLLMSYVDHTNNWSDFAIVNSINKKAANLLIQTQVSYQGLTDQIVYFTLSGDVLPGTYVEIVFNDLINQQSAIASSYTTVAGDNLNTVVSNLIANNTIGTATSYGTGFSISVLASNYNFFDVFVTAPVSLDNIVFNYIFYNDSVYPYIDINESIQLYDYVPERANAQELANGNVLIYGGITEGYNNDIKPNVQVSILKQAPSANNIGYLGISSYQGYFNINSSFFSPQVFFTYKITGTPPIGTLIEIKVKTSPNGVGVLFTQYTTVAGDTPLIIGQNLISNCTYAAPAPIIKTMGTVSVFPGAGIVWNYVVNPSTNSMSFIFAPFSVVYLDSVKITYPSTGIAATPQPTFLWSTRRNLGIAYFDQKGKTNGIVYNTSLSFPEYSEDNAQNPLIPYINAKIYHIPPIWAHSFQFYLTKEQTQFLFWIATAQYDSDYVYFDISNLTKQQQDFPTTANVLSWSFQEGDRFRLIRNPDTQVYYNSDYDTLIEGIITDPVINNIQQTDKTFVKIKRAGAFTQSNSFYNQPNYFVIQLYRSNQQEPSSTNQTYYEFAQQYPILNPGTAERVHGGMIADQTINQALFVSPAEFKFYNGDVYLKYRTSPLERNSNPYANYIYTVLDRNITDNYTSAVNSIDGRPNIIDEFAKNAYYPAFVRFGQAYQPDTNINGLPKFYPLNFDQYDYSYGDIMRFKTRDRFIRVFQKLKVGMVPLYQQVVRNPGSESLVVSDKLLNPIQYYQGDVGIGDNPESLASFNYADYFTSNIKGAICRVSQDGVSFLSIDNKINSWANANVGDPNGRFMIGAFDQRLGNYILYLSPTILNTQGTIVYDQEYGNFETFLTMYPEMMVTIGVVLISFKEGVLYVHNNSPYNTWYQGQTNYSKIAPVFNDNPYQKKTFLAISEVASQIWEVISMFSDLTTYGSGFGALKQESNLVSSDFTELEGSFEAAILRDINSPGGILAGDTMKGKLLIPTFYIAEPANLVSLNIVSLKYIDSPLTTR